jgi:hypothetical protein
MEQNKTGKYLKYAIGEIFLVVIGILIALSINNWNENRKLQKEELSLLLDVKSNLEVTLNNFKNDTLQNLNTIYQYQEIERYIQEDLPYNPELDEAFGKLGIWWSPYPILTAYETLKTKGLDIISNTSLRNKIANMYEFEFTVLITDYDKGEWELARLITSFCSKHIKRYTKDSKQLARPNDFENLKQNEELSNFLGMLITKREFGIRTYRETMISIENLIKAINEELNARQ